MPASYTHYRFGCDVLTLLPPSLRQRIEPHRGLFDIGLHGPDIFFYTNPATPNPVNRAGRAMHHVPGGRVLRRFAALDDGSDQSFAYLAGFLCHFALDSSCHGYVNQMAALGMSHPRLETQLDRSFLMEDGKDPVTTELVAHVIPSLDHARTVSRFYPQFSIHRIRDALEKMGFWHRFLMAPNAARRTFLETTFRVMGAQDTFGAMVMTQTELRACREMVKRLRLLYAEALPLAVELITAYPDLTHPQYKTDFNGRTL